MEKLVQNAHDAKKRADSSRKVEEQREYIIKEITKTADLGEYEYHVHMSLHKETLIYLNSLAFEIIKHDSLAIQKDNLYYTIKW
jgi:hypothetical protein